MAVFLPRAIDSVIEQTHKNWELIVVDDGSTDNTSQIIGNYIKQNKRIKYIYQKNSGGPAGPRNIGLEKANGEFIVFLDADDEMLPKKIEMQLSVFSNRDNLGFVGCHVFVVEHQNSRVEKILHKGNVLEDILLSNFILSGSNIMARKDCFVKNNLLFDERLTYLDDWDMWIQMALAGCRFDYYDEPLIKYHFNHGANLTMSVSKIKMIKEREYIFNKNSNSYKKFDLVYRAKMNIIFDLLAVGDIATSRKCFEELVALGISDKKNEIIDNWSTWLNISKTGYTLDLIPTYLINCTVLAKDAFLGKKYTLSRKYYMKSFFSKKTSLYQRVKSFAYILLTIFPGLEVKLKTSLKK